MSAVTGVADEARELAGQAEALATRCEALAAAAENEKARATLARVAGRLGASVVRPLGSALVHLPVAALPPRLELRLR